MIYSDVYHYATVGACGRTGKVCGNIRFSQVCDDIYYTLSCGCCTVDVHMRTHLNDIVYYIVIDGVEHIILTYTHSVGVVNHVPVATLKITYNIEVFGVPILMETTLYDDKNNQWCNPEITVSITNYDFNTLSRNGPKIDANDHNTQPHIIIANAAYGLIVTILKLNPRYVKTVVTGSDNTTATVTSTLYPINE